MKPPALIVVGAVLPALLAGWSPTAAPREGPCHSYEWTAPETLRGPGNAAMYVESPQLIRRRDTLWLVGSPTWAWTGSSSLMFSPSGNGLNPNHTGLRVPVMGHGRRLGPGTVIPTPPQVWRIGMPRAALSSNGDLHLLWRVYGGASESIAQTQTVWAARWRNRDWSESYVVLDSSRSVLWLDSQVSGVTTAGRTSYIFAPMGLKDTVFVLRLTETGWKPSAARFDNHIYPEIAGIQSDSRALFVTYVTQNEIHAGEFDVAANKVRHSARVASFPVGARIRTGALVPGGNRRSVVWLESKVGDPDLWHLRVSGSADRGASWNVGPSLQLRAGPGTLQVTSDESGRVHTMFGSSDPSPSAPIHAILENGVWRKHTLPTSPGLVVPSPSMTSWGGDSILAVWAMAESTTSRPVTLWSIGKPCRLE